jgi:hypothetical protein
MDTTSQECARTAWNDLHRAVRAATLYSKGHARVRELINGHWRTVEDGLRSADRLAIDVADDGADVDGRLISSFGDGPDALAALLFGEGIRRLQFSAGYDLAGATRLVDAIRPYFRTDQPPEQPLSDRLRWEPIGGLALSVVDQTGRSDVAIDEMTHGEHAWRSLLLESDPREHEQLPLEALRASWDCTGGSILWPAPIGQQELEELDAEVETAATKGAPMSRVGMILAAVAELWIADERLERVFALIPDEVDSQLAGHHAGEAARLLAPLRSWGDGLGSTPREAKARKLFQQLQVRLLEDRLLARLMSSILARAVEPSKAASYFAGGGPGGPARVLEFAAATPDGPYREAIVRVVTNDLRDQPTRLVPILAKAPVGPALIAFDILGNLPRSKAGMDMALDALDRSEPILRQRATSYLMRYDDPTVGDPMMQLLLGPREIRSLALVYFTRHPRPGVFECLRAVASNARFDALPLEDRMEVTRSIGFVDPERATDLALAILGPNWETGDLNRAAPWVMCLSAAGAHAAYKALVTLDRRSDESLADVVAAASRTWQRRYKAQTAGDRAGPQDEDDLSNLPPPGGYHRLTAPGTPRPEVGTRATDPADEALPHALDPMDLIEVLLEDSTLEFDIAESDWSGDSSMEALFANPIDAETEGDE